MSFGFGFSLPAYLTWAAAALAGGGITPTPPHLLKEDGDALLLESGDYILLE